LHGLGGGVGSGAWGHGQFGTSAAV
jgi:hypothetical protein